MVTKGLKKERGIVENKKVANDCLVELVVARQNLEEVENHKRACEESLEIARKYQSLNV